MTRISRIRAPRATFFAFALLAVFMLGFGVFADVAPDAAFVDETATDRMPSVVQELPSKDTPTRRNWLELCRM